MLSTGILCFNITWRDYFGILVLYGGREGQTGCMWKLRAGCNCENKAGYEKKTKLDVAVKIEICIERPVCDMHAIFQLLLKHTIAH